MVEASVSPEASTASVGFGIRYIGSHCYANSGEISPNNETLTALDFHSGAGYVLAKLFWGVDMDDMDADAFVGLFINLNDELVFQVKGVSRQPYDTSGPNAAFVEFLIPPLTKVKIEVGTDRTNAVNNTIVLTGRVYGAE